MTLVELLAVVAILALVSSLGVTVAVGAMRSEEVGRTRRKVAQMAQAVIAHYRDTGTPPPALPVAAGEPDGLLWVSEVAAPAGWRGPYLEATQGGDRGGDPLQDAWGRPLWLLVFTSDDLVLVGSSGPDGRGDSLEAVQDDIVEAVYLTGAALLDYDDRVREASSELTRLNGAIRRYNRDAVQGSTPRPFRWAPTGEEGRVHRELSQSGTRLRAPLVIRNPGTLSLADEWRALVDDSLAPSGDLAGESSDYYSDPQGRPYLPVGYGDPANYRVIPAYGDAPVLIVVEVRVQPPPAGE